jgi:hypothetical protein
MAQRLLKKASYIFKAKSSAGNHNPVLSTADNASPAPIPRGNDPAANDIPKNILAFRTITILLAILQQERSIAYSNASDRHDISPEQKRELKILNAFANIANTNRDIVALVSKTTSSDALDVVVSTNLDDDDGQLVKPLKSSKWRPLFSRNFRKDSPPPNGLVMPTIITAVKPDSMKSEDVKELIRYIDEDW